MHLLGEINANLILRIGSERDGANLLLRFLSISLNFNETPIILDLIESNKNYEKYVPVFYITIDTEFGYGAHNYQKCP